MKLPKTGFLRESQILRQREITEDEARRNREVFAEAAAKALKIGPRRARPASPGLITGGE